MLKLANNAVSTLASALSSTGTQVTLKAGDGMLFPSLQAGDWFPLTLVRQNGDIEILRCQGRSGDTLTVLRAQEGTTSQVWAIDDRVELRMTAEAFYSLVADAVTNRAESFVFEGDVKVKSLDLSNDMKLTDSSGKVNAESNENGTQTLAYESFVISQLSQRATPTGLKAEYPSASSPAGWVKLNGATIGSQLSGATGRANADTQALFELLWNNQTNAVLPIQDSTGSPTTRGATATADYLANKRLPLPNSTPQSGQTITVSVIMKL